MTTQPLTSNADTLIEWADSHGVEVPARVNLLKEADALCKQCLLSPDMLCEGTRPAFIPTSSLGTIPYITSVMCEKGLRKAEIESLAEEATSAGFGSLLVDNFIRNAEVPKVTYCQETDRFQTSTGREIPQVNLYSVQDKVYWHHIAIWAMKEISVWHIHVATLIEAMKTNPSILQERGTATLVVITGIEDLKPWGPGKDLASYLMDRVSLGYMVWIQKPQGTITVDQFIREWFDSL